MKENQNIEIIDISNYNYSKENVKSDKQLSEITKFDLPKEIRDYEIKSYPDNIEEFSKINKIIPLKKNCCKFTLLIILDVITVCIINLFIAWFPQLNLYLIYDIVPLNEATFIGVYGKDNKLVIEELKKIDFPHIDYQNENNIIKNFNMNLSYYLKLFLC